MAPSRSKPPHHAHIYTYLNNFETIKERKRQPPEKKIIWDGGDTVDDTVVTAGWKRSKLENCLATYIYIYTCLKNFETKRDNQLGESKR